MKQRKFAKILAILLAVLMILTFMLPLFNLIARAASVVSVDLPSISVRQVQGGSEVHFISPNREYRIEFNAILDVGGATIAAGMSRSATFNIINNTDWSQPAGSPNPFIVFLNDDPPGANEWNVRVVIPRITYISQRREDRLEFSSNVVLNTGNPPVNFTFELFFMSHSFEWPTIGNGNYNNGNGNGNGWDNNGSRTSDIIVENVAAIDAQGRTIREVTRDTEPFSIQITFTDHGLFGVPRRDIDENSLAAFLTDPGSFIPQGSLRGTLRTIQSASGDPPRFVATFSNLRYAGGASGFVQIGFRAQYSIRGERLSGEGSARFFGIPPDDDEENQPFTPYIILREHSFGADQIEAGSTFTLHMRFFNTSREVDLNNIVMVISPVSTEQQQSFLSIASATNTYFFESMPAGSDQSQSVDITVLPGAGAGSQAVSVEFRYEYMVGRTLQSNSITTIIHIPVIQIDRFSVDPITDYSQWMQLGDEGYVVVSFVNLGRSTVFNVGGFILDAEGNQGQTEHFGNLEAGNNGSLDFSVFPHDLGEHVGTIVIRYETEGGEEFEVETTFTIFVEEPWFQPGPDMEFPGMFEPEPEATPWWRYALFIVGGLGIAVPLALYIIKRVTTKGSEEFDEDF